jgi:hypothetical protein
MTRLILVSLSIAMLFAASRPVFPGAQGFGIDTPAGRGGTILRVSSLAESGPGTLRAAVEGKGPRIVVFETAGVIDLGGKDLRITEPFLTIAGQTAPSPGITIIRGSLYIAAHDVLMHHIRVRPGDAGRPKKSGFESEVSTIGPQAYNIVIDHCSMTWAVDENLSASGPRYDGPQGTSHRITFSNNIIAEGLYDSAHSKGIHSMGTLVHDNATEIAVIGNLYAHNNHRNPYFKAYTTGVIVNNLIYNPGTGAITVNWPESEWKGRPMPKNARVAAIGNVLYHGVNTRTGLAIVSGKGDVYVEDNLAFDQGGQPAPLAAGALTMLNERPVWPQGLRPMPAKEVTEHVLRNAGARPKDRDPIDARIVSDFRTRQGKFVDSQEDVGGYPNPKPVVRKLRIPSDVDAWLASAAAALER